MKYTCEAMRRMDNQDYAFHPYRHRKNSTTSTYSDCSSTATSPSTSTTTSPFHFYENIYDRFKQYTNEVPKDPIVYQILLESLAHVIELERHLALLEQKTHSLKMRQKMTEKVPEDLATVDVSAFKHLVHSSPLIYDSISY